MKKNLIIVILMVCMIFGIYAETQHANDNLSVLSNEKRLLLATSMTNYPVTPGDRYQITYFTAGGQKTFDFIIRGDFSAYISLFGKIDASAMTYIELSMFVEKKIAAAYRDSVPECRLIATGIFYIYVTGEVRSTTAVECWGLSRLSDVISGNTTEYSSLRSIEIKSSTGTSGTYDLFLADRGGDLSQNPYIRPGDTIILKKAERRITLSGEVKRPGQYQLKKGEELEDAITMYGDGITASGDLTRVRIIRTDAESSYFAETLYIDVRTGAQKKAVVKDLDVITVPNLMETVPVVYVEGAIKNTDDTATVRNTDSGKYIHRFSEGERVSTLIKSLGEILLPVADLKNAYVIRISTSEAIPVDLEQVVFGSAPDADMVLKPYDRVMIPLKQFFVTVSGAVRLPGRYPYVPNRSYQYYLNLAGGTDPEKNTGGAVSITNGADQTQPLQRPIEPEDKIYAEYNNALYHINQWGFVITTAVSVTALVVSIMQLSR